MRFCFTGAGKNGMNATYLENEKWAALVFDTPILTFGTGEYNVRQ